MGALKQQAIRDEDRRDYEDRISVLTDVLTMALEDAIYELMNIQGKEKVIEKINKHYNEAVTKLFPRLDMSQPGTILEAEESK